MYCPLDGSNILNSQKRKHVCTLTEWRNSKLDKRITSNMVTILPNSACSAFEKRKKTHIKLIERRYLLMFTQSLNKTRPPYELYYLKITLGLGAFNAAVFLGYSMILKQFRVRQTTSISIAPLVIMDGKCVVDLFWNIVGVSKLGILVLFAEYRMGFCGSSMSFQRDSMILAMHLTSAGWDWEINAILKALLAIIIYRYLRV